MIFDSGFILVLFLRYQSKLKH
jgi:hypothetical protein